MKNEKFWLGMLVIVLAFGMTVIGCDDALDDTHFNEASIVIKNTSSTGYYYGTELVANYWTLDYDMYLPGGYQVSIKHLWKDGESGEITIYYTAIPYQQVYMPSGKKISNLIDGETREVTIP